MWFLCVCVWYRLLRLIKSFRRQTFIELPPTERKKYVHLLLGVSNFLFLNTN